MPKKETKDMVWPVKDYRAKIDMAVECCVSSTPWLTYTEEQIAYKVKTGYKWLNNNNKIQKSLLGAIVRIACRSLIYQGKLVKVKCKLNNSQTWQWRAGAEKTGSNSTIITGDQTVVSSAEGKKYIREHGPVNIHKLTELQRA